MKNNGFIKENKGKIIISSILILLPIVAGIILWNKLPDTMAVHWGVNNEPNGYASKFSAVFLMPLFLLAIHILCFFVTSFEKRIDNINKKSLALVFWIIPTISILANATVYAIALGKNIDVGFYAMLLIGFVLCFIGNYMPKTKQNSVYGIKIPWTLKSEDNWNKTHRFAGICYCIAGVALIATTIIWNVWYFSLAALILILAPVIYSYAYYAKYEKNR
ncbi:MAG: SdpI family protein [Clostridia bacterium]|nr:SdpI family protein [Clostridia bacterium]